MVACSQPAEEPTPALDILTDLSNSSDATGTNDAPQPPEDAAGPVDAGCTSDADCLARLGPIEACQVASCHLDTGECVVFAASEGKSCELADKCKLAACHAGVCEVTGPVDCPGDEDICTQDVCKPELGCVHLPIPGCCQVESDCDDDDPCTADNCVDHTCFTTPVQGCCTHAADCVDDNPCTEEACAENVCKLTLKNGCCVENEECDDADPCTADACVSNECASSPLPDCCQTGEACDDGNACTLEDVCVGGACVGAPIPGCCIVDADCNDAEPCTEDVCNPETGLCASTPLESGSPCDDGDPCTGPDTCQGGVCQGFGKVACCEEDIDCDDDNPCTVDTCDGDSAQCDHDDAPDGTTCDDGTDCTDPDTCTGGVCVGEALLGCCTTHADCDDGNSCTTDKCNAAAGVCMYVSFLPGSECDDGNACTFGDWCQSGQCKGVSEILCTTSNPCKAAVCDPDTGDCLLQKVTNGTPCDDADACTGPDTCQNGQCEGGLLYGCCESDADCDDAEPCTTDVCQPATSTCSHLVLSGVACDDGNACTEVDLCLTGKCTGTSPKACPGKPCMTGSCEPLSGDCEYTAHADGTTCSDGDICTENDVCAAGICGGTPTEICCGSDLDCADDNTCTVDKCDVGSGKCVYTPFPNGEECDDGDACTLGDSCLYGTCGGTAKSCPSAGSCATVGCDPQSGDCQVTPSVDGTSCTDGDSCTGPDLCVSGVCKGSPIADCCTTKADCDDDNPCTTEACSGGKCLYVPAYGTTCDDGDVCTKGDHCAAGKCVADWVTSCPSYDACSAGVCVAETGECDYVALPDGTACDDEEECTSNDQCTAGVCGGSGVSGCKTCDVNWQCDDGDPCTEDHCVKVSPIEPSVCVYTGVCGE